MIRPFEPTEDMETVLDIWLRCSVLFHGFIEGSYWENNVDAMRDRFLPDSLVYVYRDESTTEIAGFIALVENYIAALFVCPERQGQGIGRKLLNHAKVVYHKLELTVYAENKRAVQFYLREGFEILREQTDANTGHRELCLFYRGNPLK